MPDELMTQVQAAEQLQAHKQDADFRRRLTSGDAAAQEESTALHKLAFPEGLDPSQVPTLAAPHKITLAPEAAKERIKALTRDPAWIKRYQEGGVAERALMGELQQQANPPSPEEAAALAAEAATPPALNLGALEYGDDLTPQAVAEANAIAEQTVAELGLPVDQAGAGIDMLQRATAQRQGKAMDVPELAALDKTLQRRWGAAYDERFNVFETAIRDLYGRNQAGGVWLHNAIGAAGPIVAANIIDQLVEHALSRQVKP